jgi:hypothetical protein
VNNGVHRRVIEPNNLFISFTIVVFFFFLVFFLAFFLFLFFLLLPFQVVFVTGCNNRLDDNTRRALERTLDLLVAAGVANVPVILLHSKVDRERALCEPCQQVAHGADSQVAQTLRAAGFSVTTELCEDAHRDPLALRQTLGAALDPLPAARPVLLPPNFEELIYKSDPAEAVRQFQEFRCGEAHAALVASHMAERELMNCRNQLQICPLVLSSCKTTRTWKCGRRRFGFAGPRRTCFEESTDPICVQKEIEKQKNCVSEQNDRIKDACSAASEALEATRARFSAICSDKCDFGPSHFLSQTPLAHGETLMEETALVSSNGLYRMVMQNDGNLVVYASTIPLWASNTQGQGQKPYRLLMQSDNNLVMFDAHNRHIWSTKTSNHGAAGGRLIVQDDGNCVIYDSAGKVTSVQPFHSYSLLTTLFHPIFTATLVHTHP